MSVADDRVQLINLADTARNQFIVYGLDKPFEVGIGTELIQVAPNCRAPGLARRNVQAVSSNTAISDISIPFLMANNHLLSSLNSCEMFRRKALTNIMKTQAIRSQMQTTRMPYEFNMLEKELRNHMHISSK